jgi:hypothetical protein
MILGMYLAINKKDPNEYHSFIWTGNDELIINGCVVDPLEWEIVWVNIARPC